MKVSFGNLYKKCIAENADKARLAAVELVHAVFEGKSYSNLSLTDILDKKNLNPTDRKFATAIAYSSIYSAVNSDAAIGSVSSMKTSKIDPYIKAVLVTAVWQIFRSEKIPDFAVCDESVKLAKLTGNKGAVSYVNGILRTIIKNKTKIMDKYFDNPKDFHLKCSMPPEMAGYFKKWFGEERAVKICRAMDGPPLLTLRVNGIKTSPERVLAELEKQGIFVTESEFVDSALKIKTGGTPLESLGLFHKGHITAQDESAMLVSLIAGPKPGQKVVDVCSAPGGKTFHLADLMDNRGKIYAMDINPSRINLVKESATRLGVEIVETKVADAQKDLCDKIPGKADLVLADVPCSGLGILRKKPEIKFFATHERMISLYEVQIKIIENASRLVKNGGYLVYSTCTLNPEENEGVIYKFLEKEGDEFEMASFAGLLPKKFVENDTGAFEMAKTGMMTVYPDLHQSDGFFMAKLRRK